MERGRKMRIYISGKITGDENYEKKFAEKEQELKNIFPKCKIINPVKISKKVQRLIKNPSMADYMKADIKKLMKCNVIYMLNDYSDSRGAKAELEIAKVLSIKIVYEINKIKLDYRLSSNTVNKRD